MNATLYKKLNFINEIAPVASIGGAPYVMVINPSVPAKTVPEDFFGEDADLSVRFRLARSVAHQAAG